MIEDNDYTFSHNKRKLETNFGSNYHEKNSGFNLHSTVVNKIHKDDFISTGYKSKASNKKQGSSGFFTNKSSNQKSSNKKFNSFVRPFCNIMNLPSHSKLQNQNNLNFAHQSNSISNTFSSINNISMNTTTSNQLNLKNITLNDSGINIDRDENTGRYKKRILSTEEILMERIEKEKQEIDKLKKTNMENLEKIFHQPQSYDYSYSTGLLAKKREGQNQLSTISIISQNSKEQQKEKEKEKKLNNLPNILKGLNKKQELYPCESDASTLKLELDEEWDYLSTITDLSKLSVKNSPQKEEIYKIKEYRIKPSSLINEKERERFKRKDEKNREIKKQSMISKMNLSIFEKLPIPSQKFIK